MIKHEIRGFFIAFILAAQPLAGFQYALKKEPLKVDFKENGFFKTVTDLKIHKGYLFIADFLGDKVLQFSYVQGHAEFMRFVGRKGRGPGDIEKPIAISVYNDIIAVKDQEFISFFDLDGNYISKFRQFTTYISFALFKDKIYFSGANPRSANLIEFFSMEGQSLGNFGGKYFSASRSSREDFLPFEEVAIYSGQIISWSDCIYFINKRFGLLQKFSLLGEELERKTIIDLFGENGRRKVAANKALFLDQRYKPEEHRGQIVAYDLFRDSSASDGCIYFLLDQHDISSKKYLFKLEIIAMDIDNYRQIGRYELNLDQGDFVKNITLSSMDGKPTFLVDIDSKQGHGLYELTQVDR
jgi:hypothetical protein